MPPQARARQPGATGPALSILTTAAERPTDLAPVPLRGRPARRPRRQMASHSAPRHQLTAARVAIQRGAQAPRPQPTAYQHPHPERAMTPGVPRQLPTTRQPQEQSSGPLPLVRLSTRPPPERTTRPRQEPSTHRRQVDGRADGGLTARRRLLPPHPHPARVVVGTTVRLRPGLLPRLRLRTDRGIRMMTEAV